MRRLASSVALAAALFVVAGCSSREDPSRPIRRRPSAATVADRREPSSEPTPDAEPEPEPTPDRSRPMTSTARPPLRAVRHLAGEIGPREATSPAYARAPAGWPPASSGSGYDVARQRVDVPAGKSWGVPVPAGRSVNVVAHAARLRRRASRTWSSAPTSTPCRRRPAPRTTRRASG